MNRGLLLVVAIAIVGLLGFGGFVIMSRNAGEAPVATVQAPSAPAAPAVSRPAPPPAAAPAGPEVIGAPPAGSQQAVPDVAAIRPEPAAIVEDAAARADFVAWAAPLRAAGMAVDAATVAYEGTDLALRDLDIAAPAGALDWQWRLPAAALVKPGSTAAALQASGNQDFSLSAGGAVSKWSGPVESFELKIIWSESRPFTTATLALRNAALDSAEGRAPLAMASADFRLNLGAGSIPPSSLKFTHLSLPFWESSALGGSMRSAAFEIGLGESGQGLAVRKVELEWGPLLVAAGAGTLGSDSEARPFGRLAIKSPDILAALDAVHTSHRFDHATFATAYAALLAEMVAEEAPGVDLALRDGVLALLGERHGIADIVLARILPLVGQPPAR